MSELQYVKLKDYIY